MNQETRLGQWSLALLAAGAPIYAMAIVGLGVETLMCTHSSVFLYPLPSNPRFKAVPILPFLPGVPWLAFLFGVILAICGLGLFFKRTSRHCALAVGALLFFGALILDVPRAVAIPNSMGLRTIVFEPFAIGAFAWLLPARRGSPAWLERSSRFLVAVSFIVFGTDHFLALAPIGTLIPQWIPWHVFWVAFFGVGFIGAGLSIGLNVLLRWGTASVGFMFAIWVFTLQLPVALGLDVIPGRSNAAAHWSSLFIAVALWGGSWALAQWHIEQDGSSVVPCPISGSA